MKSFRLFSLISLAVIAAASAAFAYAGPPLDFALSALMPIVLAVGVTAAATVLAIRHLIVSASETATTPSLRLAFPAPQTGTPPASAFA